MVSFVKDRIEHVVLDPSIADDIEAIGALEPGDMTFLGRDHADRTWLVAFTVDDGPVATAPGTGSRGSARSCSTTSRRCRSTRWRRWSRSPSPLGTGSRSTATSLSRPAWNAASLPTVLMVHGGPWARDSWGLNAEAQWLANRGYVAVQVNFRGSTGYGKNFVNAGNKQWAAAMHDDLIDAVEHGHRKRVGRPEASGDLRWLLRRLRRPGRRDLHPRRVLLRCRCCRAIEPQDADRVDPAVLGPDRGPVPRTGRQPRDRRIASCGNAHPCRRSTRSRSPSSSPRAPTTPG